MVVSAPAGQYVALTTGGFGGGYPASLMGAIAYVRQLYLDADYYQRAKEFYTAHPRGTTRPAYDRALEGVLESPRILLPAGSRREVDRMLRFSQELKRPAILYGLSEGYRSADLLASAGAPVLVNLKWPEKSPDAHPDEPDALRILEVRENAPSTPAALAKKGVRFALYSGGIDRRTDFVRAVRRALDAGLSADDALRAMTLAPAEIYGVADRLGRIEAGADIANGSVLVVDGKIVGIGHNLAAPKGTKIIEGKGLHVYPGMIDSATEMGLNEIGSTHESVDTGELGQFNPQLRAEIAVNPASEHIPVTRANGITSVMTLPMSAGRGGDGGGGGRGGASGGKALIITGQAALIHLDGWTWEEMEVRKSAAMTMRFPMLQNFSSRFADAAPAGLFPRQSQADAKKNYETQLRELKEFFDEARRYQKAKAAKAPGFKTDLKMEAMLDVLNGKLPLLALTPRERAMRDAVQFGEREKVRVVLAEPREVGKMGPELKAKNVAVIVGPTLALPAEEDDPYDSAYTLPDRFYRAGVKIAFGTFGNEFARNLPYQAATAVAFGLPHDEALKAITVNPAQIWGMGDKIGSIEEGKWADLIVTDGDPLETTTQVKQMFIKGKPVDLDNKHRRLYEKYLNRP